ncbi:MAG: hypothetical protein H6744_04600 [Deltaproteobacteria bacterium]|nr:hypothetical protein [Deltaproteobacteria bacterium]MCB9785955.1 hypothetical protein [Deltaproteobacteria bacterium]
MPKALLVATLATLLVGSAACSRKTRSVDIAPDASLLAVEVQGEGEIEKYDLTGDGKPDLIKVFTRTGDPKVPLADRPRVLARTEIDFNRDGKLDVWQYFNPDGVMVREAMDHDFDGKVDAIDYYAQGAVYKREVFLPPGTQPTLWRYYEEGKLVRNERDTTGDGKPDVFEYFDDGKIVRVGYDRDADGKPDYYEEAKEE